ncbi:MAG: ComF family protein [Candidatus Omnitrophica bacterium]|nr:ComF family protein [Candidatus Omnitrophota bacterium]
MLKGLLNGLIDVIFPRACIICKTKLKDVASIDNIICVTCWTKIKKNMPPFCFHCGRHMEITPFTKNICSSCMRSNLHFDRAFSPCVYEGVIKDLIHKFKYKNKDYLGHLLSRPMIEFIKEYNIDLGMIDLIIPIPLHRTKLREREFNQALILSNYLAKEFNRTVSTGILVKKRYTKTQTELREEKRFLNVKDSFCVIKPDTVKQKNILLIDDVLTTGATASEAAYALKDAGAHLVFVMTLAN